MSIIRLNIQTTQQNIARSAPFNVDNFNNLSTAISVDLAALAIQWNNLLVPLTSLLPNGSQDVLVNSFSNGLDGKTLYVDATADTSAQKIRYYNTVRLRPKTLQEVIDDLLGKINTLQAQVAILQAKIA